jgi:hypothetical protein
VKIKELIAVKIFLIILIQMVLTIPFSILWDNGIRLPIIINMSLIGLELIVIAILMKEPKRGGE